MCVYNNVCTLIYRVDIHFPYKTLQRIKKERERKEKEKEQRRRKEKQAKELEEKLKPDVSINIYFSRLITVHSRLYIVDCELQE